MTVIEGGVTAAKGFVASAVKCGIKNPGNDRLDLSLVFSKSPAVSASTFTTNKVQAAPVRACIERQKETNFQAILANSGNANACTGSVGLADVESSSTAIAESLKVEVNQIAVCSTGVIGIPLPMSRITPNFPSLIEGLREDAGSEVAKAIITSDTQTKEFAITLKLGESMVTIGGCAKGAGMINPNMATMLCFITTDAKITQEALSDATKSAVNYSFNRITIDGDMSTNDSVICLANGEAGNALIDGSSKDLEVFKEGLQFVMLELAKMMVRDGERVTKCVHVVVNNADSSEDARAVAEAVSNSALVKSSWNGNDPNWGRIIHAVGYAGVDIKEERINIYINGKLACENGMQSATPIEVLQKEVSQQEFEIVIDLNLGSSNYWMYSSDLSPEYVDFNRSEYAYWKQGRLDGSVKG